GACRVYGVEISELGAEEAMHNGVECFAIDVDRQQIPLADDSVDVLYCGEVIEHLYDPNFLLDDIYRILRPGGFAIIDTPNLASWYDRLFLLAGYQPLATETSLRHGSAGKLIRPDIPGGGGHLRILTLRAFKQLLASHGFEITCIAGGGGSTGIKGTLVQP